MFERLVGGWGEAAGAQLRLLVIVCAAGLAGSAALSFGVAAVFIEAMDRYGARDACFIVGALFLIVAAGLYMAYAIGRRRRAMAASRRSASNRRSLISDPAVVVTGLQLLKTLGATRALLMFGALGAAVALLSRRPGSPETP